MWSNPAALQNNIVDFARQLDCDWVGAVVVEPEVCYEYNNCHNNVALHVECHGGEAVVGWYIVEGFGVLQAIRHTVWNNQTRLIDITPYKDCRDFIMFARSREQKSDYKIPNCFSQSLGKYLEQETEKMYYVYQLVDPRTDQPFYVGKGSGSRAKTHLRAIPNTRNPYKENKIADIRSAGLEPKIEFVAENIVDEELAYTIEAELIKRHGRKGYEADGILTNSCIDNRPPNHRGKTYEDIYGPERAKEQRAMRSRLQKERGGYGPESHKESTKQQISQALSGNRNPRFGAVVKGTPTADKISQANRGKKHYTRTRLVNITNHLTGESVFLFLNELGDFCQQNNYSHGTFRKQLNENWPPSRKGKNKGLKIRFATEAEITQYNQNKR